MQPLRAFELTRSLIAIDSVNPFEKEKLEFIESYFIAIHPGDVRVRRIEVAEGRWNLLVGLGADEYPVLFNTHIDTVSPQYGPHEDDRRIYGRGACDTHGLLAAMLEAWRDLLERDSAAARKVGFLLTVDEEGGAHLGARIAGQRLTAPRFLIVGEPTANRITTFQKGLLKADLTARGEAGHSGYPERCDDALARLIEAVRSLRSSPWLYKDSQAGNTLNVIIKEGGASYNQVPGFARAGLFFRLLEPMARVRERVEQWLARQGDDRLAIEWLGGNDPVTNLTALPKFETARVAYNTDIAAFGWAESKVVLFGPGSIHQAHRDLVDGRWEEGEWIDKAELMKGAEHYGRILKGCLESIRG